MSEIKIKNVDVLCGKGGKINSIPGNIHFRKVVDLYRNEYINATKGKQKIQIATKVIKDIHRSGGRFLSLNPRTKKWEIIPLRRATEKACQALRELGSKTKARRKNGSLLSKRNRRMEGNNRSTEGKKPAISSVVAKKPPPTEEERARTTNSVKNTKTQTTNNSNQTQTTNKSTAKMDDSKQSANTGEAKPKPNRKGKACTTNGNSGEPDNNGNDRSKETGLPRGPLKEIDYSAPHDKIELTELAKLGGYDNSDDEGSINQGHAFEDDPNAKPYHWQGPDTTGVEWGTMYQQMKHFRNVFGHAAIPPNWAGDLRLANWASRQRQLHREIIKTSHRTPSAFELDCIEKLNAITFVWDYDDWRWDQCFNDATHQMNSGLDKSVGVGLPESLKGWIEEQTKLATMGKLPLERAKKLQTLSQRFGRCAKLDRAKTQMEPGGECLLLI